MHLASWLWSALTLEGARLLHPCTGVHGPCSAVSWLSRAGGTSGMTSLWRLISPLTKAMPEREADGPLDFRALLNGVPRLKSLLPKDL